MQGLLHMVHRALGGVRSSPDVWTNQEYPKISPLVQTLKALLYRTRESSWERWFRKFELARRSEPARKLITESYVRIILRCFSVREYEIWLGCAYAPFYVVRTLILYAITVLCFTAWNSCVSADENNAAIIKGHAPHTLFCWLRYLDGWGLKGRAHPFCKITSSISLLVMGTGSATGHRPPAFWPILLTTDHRLKYCRWCRWWRRHGYILHTYFTHCNVIKIIVEQCQNRNRPATRNIATRCQCQQLDHWSTHTHMTNQHLAPQEYPFIVPHPSLQSPCHSINI